MTKLLAEAVLAFQPEHYRIGPAPDEVILHYTVASGTYHGPGFSLVAVPNCGVEWDTMRGDGVMAFELKQVLRAPSGDFVCANLSGLYDLGDDGYVDVLNGFLSTKVAAKLAIRFQTGAREYRWLNRRLFVAQGQRHFASHSFTFTIFSG